LDFALTRYYPETADHEAACVKYFGASAVVADWDRDLKRAGVCEIKDLMDYLRITRTSNTKHYFVTNDGQKTTGIGQSRVYFFERHDGSAPSNGNWIDQYAGLSLGSFRGHRGQVLCKLNAENTSLFLTVHHGLFLLISMMICIV